MEPVSTAEGVPERAMVEGGAEGSLTITLEGAAESSNIGIM